MLVAAAGAARPAGTLHRVTGSPGPPGQGSKCSDCDGDADGISKATTLTAHAHDVIPFCFSLSLSLFLFLCFYSLHGQAGHMQRPRAPAGPEKQREHKHQQNLTPVLSSAFLSVSCLMQRPSCSFLLCLAALSRACWLVVLIALIFGPIDMTASYHGQTTSRSRNGLFET
jgi:hypothetical protein